MRRLTILTLVSSVLAGGLFWSQRQAATIPAGEGQMLDRSWLAPNPKPLTPTAEVRPADQTFLTFPEWYLVFSPEEQASAFKTRTASRFPYGTHILQLWESYRIVTEQVQDAYPVNAGYHLMIAVIATSTTVEYALKEMYERTVGYLTDTGVPETAEDRFTAAYTADYVAFIKEQPWYVYDFMAQLQLLWGEVSFTGAHPFRALERRYFLTTELIVKALYGKLIGLGTAAVYDPAGFVTTVVVQDLPAGYARYKVLDKTEEGKLLLQLPRYDRFAEAARQLATDGGSFEEIAGNRSAILVSVLMPADAQLPKGEWKLLFTQPTAADPRQKRVVLATPVPHLHMLLRQLQGGPGRVEHVFDF